MKKEVVKNYKRQYVIYCRRSSDEASGQQIQSIPDQIKKCIEYAKNNDLEIALKPKDFPFETEEDLKKEDLEPDLASRQLYLDTRHLFIIKESETAKIPYKRTKRRGLIVMIGKEKSVQ